MYSTSSSSVEVPLSRNERLKQMLEKSSDLASQSSKLNDMGDYGGAETMLEGAMALRGKVHEELVKEGEYHPQSNDWSLEQARLEASLAYSKTALGKHEEALALYQKCSPVIESFQREERDRGVILLNYAECMCNLKRYGDAIQLSLDALAILKRHHDEDEVVAVNLSNLAGYYSTLRKYAEAKPYAAQALKIFLKKLGKRNQYTKDAWSNYYCILKELGQDEEAKDLETDWRTAHEGYQSKNAEKLNDKQVENLRRRLEERLYAQKRAEPSGSVKDPKFYREELSSFIEQWKDSGLDIDDPAHEFALKRELSALKRGEHHQKSTLERETEKLANVASLHGDDWEQLLQELDSIAEQTKEVDSAIHDEKIATHKKLVEDIAKRTKKKPGPSKELLAEIEEIKIKKAENARKKAEAEKAAAEAAAKAAAEAAAKGKGKKKK